MSQFYIYFWWILKTKWGLGDETLRTIFLTSSTNLGLFVVKATSDFLSCNTLYERGGSLEFSLGDIERSLEGSSLEPRLLFENTESGEVGSFNVWSEQTATENSVSTIGKNKILVNKLHSIKCLKFISDNPKQSERALKTTI